MEHQSLASRHPRQKTCSQIIGVFNLHASGKHAVLEGRAGEMGAVAVREEGGRGGRGGRGRRDEEEEEEEEGFCGPGTDGGVPLAPAPADLGIAVVDLKEKLLKGFDTH